jgi:hypothetical protein
VSDKGKYRELCLSEASIPIFSRDWWLDAVAGEGVWDVAVLEKNGVIVATWPYVRSRVFVFDVIKMPSLTQCLGTWLRYPERQKYATRLSYEKEAYSALVDRLPRFDAFRQNFHYSVVNWLPLHWRGFRATTRYTYVIERLGNLEDVFGEFRENIRREIRKAERNVEVRCEENVDEFYEVCRLTFARQRFRVPFRRELLVRVEDACRERGCRRIFVARDSAGRIHAAAYVVWDKFSAYYLAGGGDPALRTSGATSLVMWTAIRFAADVTQRFDFEGSIIEPVERYFRAFGAVQKPYFNVFKINSPILKIADLLRELGR